MHVRMRQTSPFYFHSKITIVALSIVPVFTFFADTDETEKTASVSLLWGEADTGQDEQMQRIRKRRDRDEEGRTGRPLSIVSRIGLAFDLITFKQCWPNYQT